MGEFQTPKQRAKSALEIVRYMNRRGFRNPYDGSSSEAASTRQILNRATKAAFKKAGLDINDDED